jgi:hypothetical protein
MASSYWSRHPLAAMFRGLQRIIGAKFFIREFLSSIDHLSRVWRSCNVASLLRNTIAEKEARGEQHPVRLCGTPAMDVPLDRQSAKRNGITSELRDFLQVFCFITDIVHDH